jgi:hypothetical protein
MQYCLLVQDDSLPFTELYLVTIYVSVLGLFTLMQERIHLIYSMIFILCWHFGSFSTKNYLFSILFLSFISMNLLVSIYTLKITLTYLHNYN